MSRPARIALVLGALVIVVAGAAAAAWQATLGPVMPLPSTAGAVAGGEAYLVVDSGMVAVHVVPLQQEGHVALVDCGNATDAATTLQALQTWKLVVDAIFVTHGHPDHIKGCAALKAATHAPIYALSAEAPTMQGDTEPGSLVGKLGGPHRLHVAIDVPLHDGEEVTVGGRSFRAIALPGHTVGSTAFLVGKLLFLGDAANPRKDGTLGGPIPAFSTDAAQGLTSLHRLGEAVRASVVPRFGWMLFGHSAPTDVSDLDAAALADLLQAAHG